MREVRSPVNGRRRFGRRWWAVVVACGLLVAACTDDGATGASGTSSATTTPGLPDAARELVEAAPYEHGSWSYIVMDPDTGEVLHADQEDRVNFLGSTTKLFTVGTYLREVGTDATLETPVHALGRRDGDTLDGDLVLVASGDFILGSRDVDGAGLQWTSPDHVYSYASPLARPVEADPLAGLDALARQVRESGITSVGGEVLVDDRLWEPYESKEGVVTPIMVNDNLLDLVVEPGAEAGDPATVRTRPDTSYFEVLDQVETTDAGGEADITAEVGADRTVVVSGQVPAGGDEAYTAVFVPDPAGYARALFVEALGRAGVTTDVRLDDTARPLPAASGYSEENEVASLTSAPASTLAKLVLKVSHNRGAETLMCLLAVQAGSTDCTDGLTTMLETVAGAGVDPRSVFIYDGEGSDPASATPAAMVDWLHWASGEPWGEAYRDGLPDLAGDGTIMAKSGTSAQPQIPPQPALFVVQGEAGYMTTASGREVLVAVYANNATYPTVAEGLERGAPALKDWLVAVRDAS